MSSSEPTGRRSSARSSVRRTSTLGILHEKELDERSALRSVDRNFMLSLSCFFGFQAFVGLALILNGGYQTAWVAIVIPAVFGWCNLVFGLFFLGVTVLIFSEQYEACQAWAALHAFGLCLVALLIWCGTNIPFIATGNNDQLGDRFLAYILFMCGMAISVIGVHLQQKFSFGWLVLVFAAFQLLGGILLVSGQMSLPGNSKDRHPTTVFGTVCICMSLLFASISAAVLFWGVDDEPRKLPPSEAPFTRRATIAGLGLVGTPFEPLLSQEEKRLNRRATTSQLV